MGFFDGMPGEPNPNLKGWARVSQPIRVALWAPVKTSFALILLAVALVEALLSFFDWHFALASLATAMVAIGYVLAYSGVWLSYLGNRADQIHGQLISLHDEEVRKMAQSQGRAAVPQGPFSRTN